VILQTRPENDKDAIVHRVFIDWSLFEVDDKIRFEKIPVSYSQTMSFELPNDFSPIDHGTVIEIRKTRTRWNREVILKLKASLIKLINPFGSTVDGFQIFISAPDEVEGDKKKYKEAKDKSLPPRGIVNGEVSNSIFSDLTAKTTYLRMEIIESSNTIETNLVDRGELVYRIRELNPYLLLRSSGFRCELYYLNRSAKATFATRVGLPSVQFGSVFLFRNGFRVYPIGEVGDDWFKIDRRKQQGYARFLGSRDIIGRIDVLGHEDDFQEASSRNQGLIETPAVQEILQCFREHCLKRLEKYVVPVSWSDPGDAKSSDLSRLLTDPGRAKVAASVAALVDDDNVELLEYSHKLIGLLNERSQQFEPSLSSLRLIAEKTKDKSLFKSIEEAEQRFEELKKAEIEARRVADAERNAKEAALLRADAAELAVVSVQEALQEEKKINLFLRSISTLDKDTIINMHHQITIYTVDMGLQLENFLTRIGSRETIPQGEVMSALEQVILLNKKISAISRFATKANFRLKSELIKSDIASYIVNYVEEIIHDFAPPGMKITVKNEHPGFERIFNPIDVAVIIDNFISNAKKARASFIEFSLTQPKGQKGFLRMEIVDNGQGLPTGIDAERLFEKGFTTTDGSGLGLYHVRQVLGEMGGSVRVGDNLEKGASFVVEVTKK
jgi:signal transduction histidine kinase